MCLKGKCVLITGGSRGIGRSIAQAFSKAGCKVAITFQKNSSAAQDTIKSLSGKSHISICSDIVDPTAAKNTISQTVDKLGGLDIVVLNAGVFISHKINEVSYDQWQNTWEKTLSVNLIGPSNLTFCAVEYMMKNGGGKIISVSSRGAFRGEPDQPAYAASKAGLNAFSQSLSQALAPHNIYIGIVAPGFVKTDMTAELLNSHRGSEICAQSPLNRVATPKEVANAVLFLSSDGNEFTTGTIIDINGASYLRS